ncbi:MAG: hypothetical protein KKB81_05610 [Candidatus Margulisbacteria bacterium]|nr:hypothetical protein [Candidatus Margulisiibacteriota bacterium]MBU1021262.1 hypothetical protein [Candidatus Margulisiibacteriota bacterium]MBU1729249.1 hypothetical protein [Candidatus Margulisiibacteriota bacterium]MBU1954922.1 hypothetical protein [Candidatus Margulisiibacteriota bacterium]
MAEKKPQDEVSLIHHLNRNVAKLAAHMEKARFDEYAAMFSRPVKFIWFNFLAGIARGFGIAVGMTVIVALVLFFLSKMIDLPFIGYYIAQIVEMVNSYLSEGKSMLR